jgi:hypothetical protein
VKKKVVDIPKLVEKELIEINENNIIFSPNANNGKWCGKAYEGYPKGCPNYDPNRIKNNFCPQNAPYLEGKLSYNHYYLLLSKFEFGGFKDLRRPLHPNWSEKQLGNPRHWQNQIKCLIRDALLLYKFDYLLSCGSGVNQSYSMEGVGINVFATMRKIGIQLEVSPVNKIILVCLLCSNNRNIEKYKRFE